MQPASPFPPSKFPPKQPPRTRDPLPWIKFTIRLDNSTSLDDVKLCVERVLGLDKTAAALGLIRLNETAWKFEPRAPDDSLSRHQVSDDEVKRRVDLLQSGKSAGLPFRLEPAFEIARDRKPELAPAIMEHRFAVLTIPVHRRTFARTACNPRGMQFDIAYAIERACGRIKVTPCIPHPIGLHSGTLTALFPTRLEPIETSVPDIGRWHLLSVGAINATGASTLPPGITGAGVTIGHPDTGWTPHPQLNFNAAGVSPNYPAGFDLNLLNPLAGSALEPIPAPAIPFTNPFHGTRTGSLLVSTVDGTVSGVAPGATVFPIRCVRDVVILAPEVDDELIATAIVSAVVAGARVISISLGGYPSDILAWAIHFAVLSNVIVVAAAGNYWPLTVFPAGYPECIAVGGSTADNMSWAYSGRNWLGITPINISAPSEFVRNATWVGGASTTGNNEGTSFGTAIVAGAAALWLQRFGLAALLTSLATRAPLQALFMVHLAATARRPPGWNLFLDGPGILNLSSLLSIPTLPPPPTFAIPSAFVSLMANAGSSSVLRTDRVLADPLTGNLPGWFTSLFGANAPQVARDHAEEAMQLVMGNPVVSGMVQSLDGAAKAAEDAALAASDAVGDAVEGAAAAAQEAAEQAAEAASEVVDSVSDAASETISTVSGWLGF